MRQSKIVFALRRAYDAPVRFARASQARAICQRVTLYEYSGSTGIPLDKIITTTLHVPG